jgi:uncharacterized protein YbaA (DUF1428 family)
MTYVDGFVAAVETAERENYRQHCERAGAVFRADETVVFGWITWPSRAARDAGMAKAMADPRLQSVAMPFDGKRMIFGGFETLTEP